MTTPARRSDLPTTLANLEKRVTLLERTSSLSNASIGSGGLIIRDGGSIFLDGGDLIATNGGHIALANGGIFTMQYVGGAPFLDIGADAADSALFKVSKPNGLDLISATVQPSIPNGRVRIGQSIDGTRPDIFLEGDSVGIGSQQNIVLAPAVGQNLRFINIPNMVGSANLRVDASGNVGWISSLSRLKIDVEPLQVDPDDVLKVEPVTYQPEYDPNEPRQTGVIAEQVESIGGMEPFLTHDLDGELTGFDYGAFPMALLEVAKAQADTIKQQQQQIDALTARLDAIEGAENG